MLIIALTGKMGAGKGAVAELLKHKGFEYHSYSDIISEEAKRHGYKPTRQNLRELGNLIRMESGNIGILSERLLSKIKTDRVVLDGVRNLAEIEILRHRKNFFLIGIDADEELRFERIKKRRRNGDPTTFEMFTEIDKKENLGFYSGQEIQKCLDNADFLILNKGSAEELAKKINSVLAEIENRMK